MDYYKKKNKKLFLQPQLISRHLHCSICHQVFDDPVRTICGQQYHLFRHTFCYLCIQSWAVITKKCPNCKTSIKQRKLEKDYIAGLIIDDFKIKCGHENCNWEGNHAIYKKHQRNCQFRQKKEFIAPTNGNSIILDQMSDQEVIQDITYQKH